MATLTMNPEDVGVTVDSDIAVADGFIRLMAYDQNGDADDVVLNPAARYANSGEFEFRNLEVSALRKVWGSDGSWSTPGDSQIKFYVSSDGGSTYSSAITYNPKELWRWFEDQGDIAPAQIRLKAELIASSDNRHTPFLGMILFHVEADYDLIEDVARTLRKRIYDYAVPKISWNFEHLGGNSFTLNSSFNSATLVVQRAEIRDGNLVSSYNPTTGLVTLTTSIPEGDRLEVQGEMINVATFIQHVNNDFVQSRAPYYLVRVIEAAEYEMRNTGNETEKKMNFTSEDYLGRIMEIPITRDVSIAVDAVSVREVEAYNMARAVRDLFTRDDLSGIWQSRGLGYFLDIVGVEPIFNATVTDEEFHDFQVRAIISGKEYSDSFKESTLATEFEIIVNNREKVEVTG